MNCFNTTNIVVEIPGNDPRQPSHEADVVLQTFHVKPLPTTDFFGAGFALQTTHAERQHMVIFFDITDTIAEIAVNGCRQPPHEADVGM